MVNYHKQRNARNLEAYASGLLACTEVKEMVEYAILNHKILLKEHGNRVHKPTKINFDGCRFTKFSKVYIKQSGYGSTRYYHMSFMARCPNPSTLEALRLVLKAGVLLEKETVSSAFSLNGSVNSDAEIEVHKGVKARINLRIPFGKFSMLDSYTNLAGDIIIPEVINDDYGY